ncbi:FCD domain-containing protein [Phreatobacter stygius]|uniref:FCD domain-containing protein n=1 Tax=Phreatobacter stygius TaxID=1940610 RepID=A0A4D7BN75_9HYPH|nr:FCD domain-containing protein [Phreatobacter stygius]
MGHRAATKSLTEAAYLALRADILACRLAPGEKIKINDICASRGVSLGAIREALSRLTADGLVVAEAQRGFSVAPVSQDDLIDLTSTRIEMELACLGRALERGDVEWETGIVAAYHRLSRTPERVDGDPMVVSEDWALAHKAFHAALVAACDSPWRLRLRAILYDQSERYRRLSVPAASHERPIDAEHRALMDAALARDVALVGRLMRDHLNETTRRVLPLAMPTAQAKVPRGTMRDAPIAL